MSRQEESKKGIVLKQIDYKDNDAIINVLSQKGELLSLYARGVKKTKSKNAAAILVFTFAQFDYFLSQKGLHTLKKAKKIENYYEDINDYNKIIVAFMLLDITLSISRLEVEANIELFKLLKSSLSTIKKVNEHILLAYFLIKILKQQGLYLNVDNCSICKSQKVSFISYNNGGFICHNCAKDEKIENYDVEILKIFRIINKIDIDNLPLLEVSEKDSITLVKIVYNFFVNYTGIAIKNFQKLY